jgi:Cu/Ag efflux pump CusA
MLVVPACFALIMLLLFGALGNIRDAAIVFTGVPLALVGGVLAHCSCGACPSRSRQRSASSRFRASRCSTGW